MAPWQFDYRREAVHHSSRTTLIVADSHGRYLRRELELACRRQPGREAFIVAFKPGGVLNDAASFLAKLDYGEVVPGLKVRLTRVIIHMGTNDLVTRAGQSRPENVGPKCGTFLGTVDRLREKYSWYFQCGCWISLPLPRQLEDIRVHKWYNDTIRYADNLLMLKEKESI